MAKQTFPVLFIDDLVVLPDMVVPLEITDQAQGALDAARAGRTDSDRTLHLLLVPRIDGSTGSIGVVAEVAQIARTPTGEAAMVLRGAERARIGTGVPGPGAALWVETEPIEEPEPSERARELAAEFKQVITSILPQRT